MLQYFLLCVSCVVLTCGPVIGNRAFGPQYPPTKGEVWPKPHYQKKTNHYYVFNPSKFTVNVTGETCDILTRAVERYGFIVRRSNLARYQDASRRRRVAPDSLSSQDSNLRGHLQALVINLNMPCEEYPHMDMDESYDLVISSTSVLTSMSIWGILRGLESWSQLFYFTDDNNQVRINATHIIDYPRFSYRGILLDTSRHYLSLSNILKNIDAMAMNKMNVFHWHIVDDQSFPYQSEKFPDLSRKGAYHSSMIYTKADIQKVIEYARDRGIRVLPEFDVPGHTRSWGEAYPNILAKCYDRRGKVSGLGPMDPTNNTTYKLLSDLIQEVQELFPDKYFHVGGDEVDLDCWSSNPDLQRFMREHNMTTSQLHGLFMSNVIPLLGDRSKPIVWQEVFDEGVELSPDTLVHVWKGGWEDEVVKILQAGKRLIFSSAWYLDHLKSGGDWIDFWKADPTTVGSRINKTLLSNIVGGEACMWGEVVDDVNVISRTWPRSSAVAERLWSPALPAAYHARADAQDSALHRIEEHTCRMRRRGVRAQPPSGPGFCLGAI